MIALETLDEYLDDLIKIENECRDTAQEIDSSLEENKPVDYETHEKIVKWLTLTYMTIRVRLSMSVCYLAHGRENRDKQEKEAVELYHDIIKNFEDYKAHAGD